ncbi:MAG: disulfide bond formation protein B [Nitrospirota bacterium]|nr:MAG: disulfide bond formation protein B [Nitrospirota bacterium]
MKNTDIDTNWIILFAAWLIAAVGLLGSLFFSEVMEFAPCTLCWFERIFLYPLVITLAIGLFPFDRAAIKYSLPLAITGLLIAFYHNLVYFGIISEDLTPCKQGVSCSDVYIKLLGFIDIPLLALMSFAAIIVLLFILKRRLK